MSRMCVTAAQILADCPMVVGFGGWGVLGSELPATGEHGPSVGYQWIDPIEDASKEVWVRITTQPSTGTLLMLPDSSFEYEGPGGTAYAQLYVDGQPVDTPQPVTFAVGAAASVSSDLAGAWAVRGSVSGDLSGSYQIWDGYSISPSQAALLYNLYRLHGLAEPLTVSPSLREVASLQQQVTSLGGATTIETIFLPVEAPLNPGLLIEELAALHGLTVPLTVTSEGRTAGAIAQSFSSAGNLTVITRQ